VHDESESFELVTLILSTHSACRYFADCAVSVKQPLKAKQAESSQ